MPCRGDLDFRDVKRRTTSTLGVAVAQRFWYTPCRSVRVASMP